jgi:hypothetical protein
MFLCLKPFFFSCIVPEPGQLLLEGHFEKSGRPVSLFGNNDLRHVPVLIRLWMIELVAVNEGNHVGILLDGTAFAKIGKLRLLFGGPPLSCSTGTEP